MTRVTLEGLRKAFGRTEVIRGVDLEITDRELVVVVGPSGCGKSTLLRLIAGLEDISAGRLLFDDEEVSELEPAERGIAMVFQSYALYPHMSVYENMAFGLKLGRRGRAQADERVRAAARTLQIEPLLDRKPRELSGGQRQRVAIGRAIVREPRVFLFDEPLSNLDAALRVQMRIEIARLHQDLDATMIYVTHDQVEAMTLADRIVVLNTGVVEQFGTPLELYHRPGNQFVAGFIGSPRMNFMSGVAAGGDERGLMVRLDDGTDVRAAAAAVGQASGRRLTVGLRPESLILGGGGDSELRGRVVTVEQLGSEAYVFVEHPSSGEPIVAKVAGSTDCRPGTMVPVGIPAAACYLFGADGRALPPAPRA